MATRWVWGAGLALAAGLAGTAAPGGATDGSTGGSLREATRVPGSPEPRQAEAGDVCATGCSAVSYVDGELSPADFELLLEAWEREPGGEAGRLALDTLLFYGEQTAALAWRSGFGSLAPERAARLASELERDHAWLSVRLVNEAGEERLALAPTRVPLGVKQHILAHDTTDLQPPEVSGTVKRVGLSHLWVRL